MFALMSRFPLPRFASHLVECGGNRGSGRCGGMQHPPIVKSAHFCTMSPAHGASFSGQGCAWLCVCDARRGEKKFFLLFFWYFSVYSLFSVAFVSRFMLQLSSCCSCCSCYCYCCRCCSCSNALLESWRFLWRPCCVFIALWVQRNDA